MVLSVSSSRLVFPLLPTVGVDVHAHDVFRVVMQGEIDEVELFDAL
jgi:hypothetical protein